VQPGRTPLTTSPLLQANWFGALAESGVAVTTALVPHDLTMRLGVRARLLHEAGKLERAGIGRADDHMLDRDIRRDHTLWLSGDDAAEAEYLALMEELRGAINAALMLGLFHFEAHYAVYEPGGFYKRHRDAFKGARNRVLSTVLYLNQGWKEGDGGELVVYGDDAAMAPLMVVAPEAGTMVVFLSEDIPHEVRTAHQLRCSIAGWYRVNEGVGAAFGIAR
jgi:SM-20-related protein